MHFGMMNGDSMNGSRNMMQFMKNLRCQFHWDSLMSDSAHRHWHVKGMKGWNGTAWSNVGGTVSGNIISFSTSETYSAFAFTGTSSVSTSVTDRRVIPGEFRLEQNYPNPFNPSTTIRYGIPHQSVVTLIVFNTLGQEVATLVNESQDAGNHDVRFDGTGLASGVYFYRLRAGDYMETKRLLLLR